MTCSRILKRKLTTGIALGLSAPRMPQRNKRPKHAHAAHRWARDSSLHAVSTTTTTTTTTTTRTTTTTTTTSSSHGGSSSNTTSQQHAGSSSNSTRLVLSYHESHKRKKLSEPGPVTMDMRQHVWHPYKREDGSTYWPKHWPDSL